MEKKNGVNYVLVLPSIEYKDSFLEMLAAIKTDDSSTVFNSEENLDIDRLSDEQTFKAYCKQLRNESKGIGLPKNYIAHTIFWLLEQKDDNNRIVGRVDIRHKLNEFLLKFGGHIGYLINPNDRCLGLGTLILKLALEKSKSLIEDLVDYDNQVLVTCNVNNVGSQKIIEKNAGVLIKLTDPGPTEPYQMFYWIKV